MEETERARSGKTFPIILIAAVIQGWALYGLYLAVDTNHWPATQPAWLTALSSLAMLVPATVQLLADHMRKPAAIGLVGALSLILFYMGWYGGSSATVTMIDGRADFGGLGPFAFELVVLWLLALPFLQSRLIEGSWRLRYEILFATAWRNKLALAEAAAFTAALWLLLMLWQALFGMLGIRFFRELFREPLFIYPVTSITFGLALHLIGSVERFTSIVLEQVLNVLKWLAVVAGVILALFTVTLAFKLPILLTKGDRIIGAVWLLWLVAVIVLLLNAAYRDGTVEKPYPRWIAMALRAIVPLAAVISLTALYSLCVRTSRYGLTVERVWALVVAAAAIVYSIGYAIVALRDRRWMAGMARVNIVAALALIAVIALALTPVLSPYRLAANSQARIVASRDQLDTSQLNSALTTLRFDTGKYGQDELRQLREIKDHPQAQRIRDAVAAIQLKSNRWGGEPRSRQAVEEFVASLPLYPAGSVIEEPLKLQVMNRYRELARLRPGRADQDMAGIFVDLDGDGRNEFVVAENTHAEVFERTAEGWTLRGSMINSHAGTSLKEDLAANPIETREPRWKHLVIGKREYRPDQLN